MVEADPNLDNQRKMLESWQQLLNELPSGPDRPRDPEARICATVEEAALFVGSLADDRTQSTRVLVTGSLHLIGACLTVLGAEVV